jgi:hypothetical protein
MAPLNQALLPAVAFRGPTDPPKSATGTEDEAPLRTRCTLAEKCNGIMNSYFNWLSLAVAKCQDCNGQRNGHLARCKARCRALQKKPFATAFATAQTRLSVTIRANRKGNWKMIIVAGKLRGRPGARRNKGLGCCIGRGG